MIDSNVTLRPMHKLYYSGIRTVWIPPSSKVILRAIWGVGVFLRMPGWCYFLVGQ